MRTATFQFSESGGFTESPEPLHWIAFPVEILTKTPPHWIASPLFTEKLFFTEKCFVASPPRKSAQKFVRGKAPGIMGCRWEGRELSSALGHSEQLDGRNWLLMVAPSIVLAISHFVYRQSNEEQDGQNEFMDKIQPLRRTLNSDTPLGSVWEKNALRGHCWEHCPFSAFPKKVASQQSPQRCPFCRHSSQQSPRHFWAFGLSQSCSRRPRFQIWLEKRIKTEGRDEGTLLTLTSLNEEPRPFLLGDNSFWSFPSVSSLVTAFEGSEGYSSLVIIAFESIVP